MTEYTKKKCPACGQQLRIPRNVGGMLMACPSCGAKFHSDFKLGGARKRPAKRGLFITIFELPYNIVSALGRFIFPR